MPGRGGKSSSDSAVLAACILGAAAPLAAARYPERKDPVTDLADVIDPEDEAKIGALWKDVLDKKQVPIVVVTIRSLAEQDAAGWTIERYAAGLYNEWGIGAPPKNLGFLLLVSAGDRKLRIATGAGLSTYWDGLAREIMDTVIVPNFRRGNMSEGIRSTSPSSSGRRS